MEFGFSLPGRGPLAGAETILKLATKAESLRFSSLFVTDHVVLPASMARSTYPYSTTGQLPGGAAQDYLEPLVTMGWLARGTSRIRLGTRVLVIPYRNPLLVAKMLATIDRLSGGRVILRAGLRRPREEFEALGAPPFDARGAGTDRELVPRGAAALPGNGGRGRRRHPCLPGGRRHALRVRSDGAGAEGGADEHGTLRPRRQRQRRETRTASPRISNTPSPCSRTMITHDEAV